MPRRMLLAVLPEQRDNETRFTPDMILDMSAEILSIEETLTSVTIKTATGYVLIHGWDDHGKTFGDHFRPDAEVFDKFIEDFFAKQRK